MKSFRHAGVFAKAAAAFCPPLLLRGADALLFGGQGKGGGLRNLDAHAGILAGRARAKETQRPTVAIAAAG